ncbi:MAG: right-handed parallel beta-helix repeat-containing protein [Lachnospiraceae bacterium]|nr:right-handed parallel beta-helix repeat-containing protein [Lachnospiraceae bacterium]
MKKQRKWLHLLLVICLIAGSILPYLPAMKLTVSAQETEGSGSGEVTTTTVNKIYVDGVGSDTADGLTKDTAVKTLAEAYALIGEGNEKTYIVICGNVDASDSGLISYLTIENADKYKNTLMFPAHSGEVVLTSKIGAEDYTQAASLSFGSGKDKQYMLQGATTFENINISSYAKELYAGFYNLTLGDGITGDSNLSYYPAQTVYLGFKRAKTGLSYNNDNNKASAFVMNSGKLQKFYAGTCSWTSTYSNMSVTVNGGVIDTLYGTSNINSSVQSKVEITINGGNVNKCYGVCNQANVGGDGVTITIKKDATVGTVSAVEPANTDKNYVAKLNGPATLNLVGYDLSTAIPGIISGFDYLGLTNSTVQIAAAWDGMTGVKMTDNSLLKFEFAPTEKIEVVAFKSGAEWQTTNPLIQAPSSTAADIFNLMDPMDYQLACTGDANGTYWTMEKASISIGESGTPGTALNLDLGLPNGNFTPIDADADAYEVYQQKVADLGEAATEVKVIEPVTVQGEVELHVSPQGNDDNNGSMASPFKTITKALSYVEALENLDVKGIVIYLHEGIYVASDSIVLNEKHSGTNGIPVIISAYGDDEVVVTGGTDIAGTSFTKVTDETVLNRLQESIRDQIMVVDLKELGISEFGSIVSGRYGGPNYSVEMNGEKLTLARYPDATNLPLGEVLDVGPVTSGSGNFNNGYNSDSTGTEFVMQDLRPTMWENDGNIWLYGNLAVEWAKRHSRVAEIRTATSSIKLEGGVVEGAVSAKSHTYYYYNVLEELNVPGEFYLDHATGKLYIYPIGDMSTATVSFTANASDLFSISGASNIVLNGITIENSGGTGINISSGSQNILVQNCVIRKVHTGAKVYGKNSGIIYSEIYEISERPVQVGWPCSTHKYDEPEHNFVQNCYIYSTGMVGISNTPIYVEGVQNVVSHNLIQGTYAVSIYLYAAAECIVEYNEIVGGPDGTYDYGSIYASPAGGQTGNHIRYNYIHDTARFSKQGNPHSIYLDEGARGNFVYGNVMTNVQNGVYLHFGSDNVVVDNVVMSFREGRNEAGIFGNEKMADKTIAERWERSSTPKQMYELWASYSEADKLVFKQRYPGYADLYEKIAAAIAAAGGSTDTGVGLYMAEGNYAKNNILVGFGGVDFAGREHVVIDNDVFTEDPFADAANHDYALKSGVETSFTYAPLNMSRVGVLCEKKGIEAFSLYAPAAAFEEVDPFNVLLKWTLAGGADTYRVTIASNEALTENVKEFTVEDTCLYMDHDEYFGFGQTCYWKVTANTTAESRVATPVSSTVSSFKTMTEDIYYQYNSADLTELTEVIQEANTVMAQMTEISEGGLYYDGSKESLQTAIAIAQAVVDAGVRQEQTGVNVAVSALESAILTARASKAVTYVTFEELNASEWSDPSAARGQAAVSGDELQLSFQTGSRTEVVYDKLIGSREILCFDFALDQQNNWHGFAIGQSDRGKFITNSTGYFVCFSGDEIQLQKYIDGKKVTGADLLKITNTGEDKMFASGQTYSIQLGALQNADGSVRILFKVDGNVIIDYLDTENPVIGDNGFGVVIQKLATNGVAHLKLADLTEAEKADYTALETELAKEETLTEGDYTEESWAAYQQVVDIAEVITKELTSYDQMIVNELVYELQIAFNALEKKTVGSEIEIQINNNTGIGENVALITAPADGWTEGTNTFTVTSEKASVVLVSYDGGVTYERLAATKADDDAENSYRFTAENVTADTQITVAVAGDVNGDGKISNADITKLRLAYAQKTELDAVQEILADVNGSNSITNADITKLRLAYAGKSELIW